MRPGPGDWGRNSLPTATHVSGYRGARAPLLRSLERIGKSVGRSTERPKIVLTQSTKKARQERDPLLSPSMHDSVTLPGR